FRLLLTPPPCPADKITLHGLPGQVGRGTFVKPVETTAPPPEPASRPEGWARALFEGIDDAVFVHDLQGRILDANPAACQRLGYSHAELLRLTTRDIDAPEFAAGFAERLQCQLSGGHLRCE